jgi:plastocyanin
MFWSVSHKTLRELSMNVRHFARRRTVWFVAAAVLLMIAALAAGCGGSSAITTTSGGTTVTSAPAGTPGSTATTGGTGTTSAPVGTVTSAATTAQAVQVVMKNRAYDPQQVTVKVGDTVSWVNQDSPNHDVVADNGEFKSELFGNGGSFSFTFTKAGTYPYHCSIHPGMVGTVIVQ